MTHDFAKIRPEPLLDRKPAQTPPAWSMMVTGILVGMALGVFACVLFYLSGRVPPLTAATMVPAPLAAGTTESGPEPDAGAGSQNLQLEFYTELQNYEVPVETTPVPIEDPDQVLPVSYMLQAGAFQQRNLAEQAMQQQQALGLEVRVKAEVLTGRTLYLVQSGPYTTRGQLIEAERILRRNNIPSLRTSVQ